MASVPQIQHVGTLSSQLEAEHTASYSLQPDQRRLRHIKTIIIRNIRFHNQLQSTSPERNSHTAGDLIKHIRDSNRSELKLLGLTDQLQKQLKLQNLNETTFFDTFYTINDFLNVEDPFYVSPLYKNEFEINDEVNFMSVNKKSITINLFIKFNSTSWRLLTQFHLKLSFLVNLGNNLGLISSKLGNMSNLLILRLTDGCYYTSPTSHLPMETIKQLNQSFCENTMKRIESFNCHEQSTCSFDQIMKLNNYTVCILDLIKVKKELTFKVETHLTETNGIRTHNEILDLRNRTDNLKKILSAKQHQIHKLKKKLASYKHNIKNQPSLSSQSSRDEESLSIDQLTIEDTLSNYLTQLDQIKVNLNQEKARIASNLELIFPITQADPIPSQRGSNASIMSSSRLNLKLFDYQFPNNFSHMTRIDLQGLNASLGCLTLLLIQLSKVLNVPLVYPLHYLGSTSYIIDPTGATNKLYPLFLNNSSSDNSNLFKLRFKYALYLFLVDLNLLFKFEKLVNYRINNGLLINFKILLDYLSSLDSERSQVDQIVSGRVNVNGTSGEFNDILISQERIDHIKMHLLNSSESAVT